MKKLFPLFLLTLFSVTGCNGWVYNVPTFPAPPPTITPSILTPTPVIITITNTPVLPTVAPTETATETAPPATATTIIEEPTSPSLSPIIVVDVLGCNTSIDITHGMGEVTNAFVTLKNNTGTDMTDVCTTLVALDEGRVHPDKTVCVSALAHTQQVTLKLTVDSTYQENTPIQIEVKSGETLLSRVGQESCTDIGLFAPAPGLLLTPVPIQ